MGMIENSKVNKEFIRQYYQNLYEIELSDANIEITPEIKKEIANEVDRKIKRYLNGHIKRSIFKYMSEDNRVLKKYYARLLTLDERIYRAKTNHKEGLDNLIRYYQNYYEYDLKNKSLEQDIKNVDKIQKELSNVLKDSISDYIINDKDILFIPYIKSKVDKIYYKHGIHTDSVENNMILDYKKTGNIDKQELYNLLLPVKIKNSTKLSDEQFSKFVNLLAKEKIDQFLDSKENISKIRNYMLAGIYRTLSYPEYFILAKYNIYFDDAKELILKEFSKLVEQRIKLYANNNDLSISKCYKLQKEINNICAEVLNKIKTNSDLKHIEKKIDCEIKKSLDKLTINRKGFEIELVKTNPSKEVLENEEQILIDELQYLKDKIYHKYNYYVTEEEALDKIDSFYKKEIHHYIYNILPKNNPKQKNTAPYISIRLNDDAKRYSNTTLRLFKKPAYKKIGKKEIWTDKYLYIVNSYIENNKMSEDEKRVFINYIENECKYFITQGSYKEEFETFLMKAIIRFDYEKQLEINKIVNFKENDINSVIINKTKRGIK